MSHKFKIGQRVSRARVGLPMDKGVGEVFEVLRLMPEDQTGEPLLSHPDGGRRAGDARERTRLRPPRLRWRVRAVGT